jgi:hypothetical protein
LKSHFVAHHVAKWRFELFGNSFGHTAGRNTPGLRMTNPLASLAWRRIQSTAAQSQGNFGQLCGFARSGLTADNDDLMFRHGFSDFVALCRHRQRLWELDFQRGGRQRQNFCKNQGWRKA